MTVYLIPAELYDGVTAPIPAYVLQAVQQCQVFFVENERTARRYLKRLWKEMVIDDYRWHTIHKAENEVQEQFAGCLKRGETVGIISEAGCPGVADPGQLLVAKAQQMKAVVKPLTGPSSILLALMASGMNGQQFKFNGYLPIDITERKKQIQQLEEEALKFGTTQIFIETPYRNDALLKDLATYCRPQTRLCIAADITAASESIVTQTVQDWKKTVPQLHKRPVIFLLGI